MRVCRQKRGRFLVWTSLCFTLGFLCMFVVVTTTFPTRFTLRVLSDDDQGQAVKIDFESSPTGQILRERRKSLLRYCHGKELLKAGNNTQKVLSSHFVYDESRRFVYCAAEKVGSTFWRRLFQIIAGKSNKTNPFEIASHLALGGNVDTFGHKNFDFVHALLHQSTKFVISRDPYSRLFSAYANKLFQVNPQFWSGYGKMVLKRSQRSMSKDARDCGRGITFPDLVKYVIYSENVGNYRDGHFTPLTDHCRPCQIKYDIIAKMETIKDDTIFVLDHLKLRGIEGIQNLESGTDEDSIRSTSAALMGYLKSYSKCVSRAEGLRRSWRSFQYRGLIGKDIKYPLTDADERAMDERRLADVLLQATSESGERKKRLLNRYLVLEEAYSLVPKDDLYKLSELFKHDCGAFGYDCYPKYIFNRTDKLQTNFLDIWSA